MSDIKIDEIRKLLENITTTPSVSKEDQSAEPFSSLLDEALKKEAGKSEKETEKGQVSGELQTGQLQETISQLEKADESYKKIMDVKEKLLDVYQKIAQTENKE